MASSTSYKSKVNLYLSRVPTGIADKLVYTYLTGVLNALEVLSSFSDSIGTSITDYASKRRGIKVVANSYIMEAEGASTILVSSLAGNITITLPPAASAIGYRFEIKHAAGAAVNANTVLVRGEGTDTIDGSDYILDLYDSISVKSSGSSWYVY